MKRLLVLVGLGALAASLTGCTTSPPAATVNGVEISQATLKADLSNLINSRYALCATQIQRGQTINVEGVGSTSRGNANAATTAAAATELQGLILDELETQALARHGATVTSADIATAKQDYLQQLSSDAAQSTVQCAVPTTQLATKLPKSFVERQAASLAKQEQVEVALGHVDVSEAALRAYYRAHISSVNQACLNLIIASTQAAAQHIHDAVEAGKTFPQAAQSPGVSTASPAGGQVGCVYPSEVVGQFGTTVAATVDNLPVGHLAAPIEWTDQSTGQPVKYWLVVQMRQRNLVPEAQLDPQIRQVLLGQGAAAVTRALTRIANSGRVTVDPQYGTWHGLRGVDPPASPPLRFVPNPAANTGTTAGAGLVFPGGTRTPAAPGG